ncbi:MAG: ABC transporter substrate-binding protein [Clostridiales bacterium]|jgi:simple sugar transport system substrate-binding protein|nr:ABC transporter substrate-binding protein [Clostridiales bacterium]
MCIIPGRTRIRGLAALIAAAFWAAGCSGGAVSETDPPTPIVLGFAQVGAESGWRTASTKSIKESAAEYGIELKFSDGQQKQENQITAIRGFIAQKVDVIAFSPIVETGWDNVLADCKDAGIPVVLLDRSVKLTEGGRLADYYVSFIGSDFAEEGRRAAAFLTENARGFFPDRDVINVYELEGTPGSAPTIDRKSSFDYAVSAAYNPKIQVVVSEPGNFTRAEGRQIVERWLADGARIDVLFSHNDDMALGAIKAFEAAGIEPGKDVMIIGVDGIRDALEAIAAGKMNCSIECNPLLGPKLMETAQKIAAGDQNIPKRVLSEEGVFTAENAEEALPLRKY